MRDSDAMLVRMRDWFVGLLVIDFGYGDDIAIGWLGEGHVMVVRWLCDGCAMVV